MNKTKLFPALSLAGVLTVGILWSAVGHATAGTIVTGTVGCQVICSDLYEVTCNKSQVMFVLAGPDEAGATVVVSAVKTLPAPAPAPGGPRQGATQLIGPFDTSEISFERPAKGTLKALVSMASQTGTLPVNYKLNAACGVLDETNSFVEVAPPIVKLKQDK